MLDKSNSIIEGNYNNFVITSKTENDIIYISKSNFMSLMSVIYIAGYNQGYSNCHTDNNNMYSQSILTQGVGTMNNDTKTLLEKIDKVEDRLGNKIDVMKNDIHELDKKIECLHINIDNISNDVKAIKEKQNSKKQFWLGSIVGPIISAIVVGIILLFAEKLIK